MRIDGASHDEVTGKVAEIFREQLQRYGQVLPTTRLMARCPPVLLGYRALNEGVQASGLLPAALVALVNRRVASHNGCPFWMDINAARASRSGVSDRKILDLDQYADSPLYSAEERAALAWADAMTLSHMDPGDNLFEELRAHFDEDAIIELTAAIALENFRSKFNRAMRIPEQGFWSGGGTG